MKSTGIVRKVDQLGRIVVPIELRRLMSVEIGDPIEIFTEGDSIIMKKYEANNKCAITGEIKDSNHKIHGINLSKEGAEILLSSLENYLGGENK